MYIWRRSAGTDWWNRNEGAIISIASNQIAVIERPNRKRLQIEVSAESRAQLNELTQKFGGTIRKLPRDWLERFRRRQRTGPINVAKGKLFIPAGAAFGTGQHATTALCLGMLQRVARNLKGGWTMVDLGTGTGILALAAKMLGATSVVAIDSDPVAISTAEENAKRNRINGVKFKRADATTWKFPKNVDVVTANLFSELLIKILPGISQSSWLIISGLLREQEKTVVRAMRRNLVDLIEVRRRGKWVAILAKSRENQFAQQQRGS
jgi:ribosomal protein L11 methyltransferase